MDEQDRAKHQPTDAEPPPAEVVSLVTLTESTLTRIVNTRDPEATKRELSLTWIRGSMIAIAIQMATVLLATFRARDLEGVTAFLKAIYPLMLQFNLTVICPPVGYMVASYFARKEAQTK